MYAYCGNNPVNWIDPWGLENNDSTFGWRLKLKRSIWGAIAGASGGYVNAGNWVLDKTEGIRGPVGIVVTAVGGTALAVSGPGGWALGAAAVTTEVGAILTISDFVFFKEFAEEVLRKVEEPQQERENIIDQIDQHGLKECPEK